VLCNFGHDHSQQQVIAATRNPSHPRGLRPIHCPDCTHVVPQDRKPKYWQNYANVNAAIGSGEHTRTCAFCFPR